MDLHRVLLAGLFNFSLAVIGGLVGISQTFGEATGFDPFEREFWVGLFAPNSPLGHFFRQNPVMTFLGGSLVLLLVGLVLQNFWVAVAGVMAHIYSSGLAGWDEAEDLRLRFGGSWDAYCRRVPSWVPRTRPWHPPDQPDARLYVAEHCGMCSEVGDFFQRRRADGLVIVPAESHPTRTLTRITYEPGDGTRAASGVEAVGRALEHLHLGWAFIGCALRLPVLRQSVQLLVDASGGEPRSPLSSSKSPYFPERR
jgi:hypothetical protein